jgi:hypothetical protein
MANRFDVLAIEGEEKPQDAEPASSPSATAFLGEKGHSKIGYSSLLTLVLAFIVSGETISASDKVIDKLASRHLDDVFGIMFDFYNCITRCSSHMGKVLKPLFIKPENFVMIYAPDIGNARQIAKENSNSTLLDASSTTIAIALQQRIRAIMSRMFGSFDEKTKTFCYANEPSQWTAEKLALLAGNLSQELLQEADEFLSYVNFILGTNEDGVMLSKFIIDAYKKASDEKSIYKASLPQFVPTIRSKVTTENGETKITSLKFIVRKATPVTDSDNFTLFHKV